MKIHTNAMYVRNLLLRGVSLKYTAEYTLVKDNTNVTYAATYLPQWRKNIDMNSTICEKLFQKASGKKETIKYI